MLHQQLRQGPPAHPGRLSPCQPWVSRFGPSLGFARAAGMHSAARSLPPIRWFTEEGMPDRRAHFSAVLTVADMSDGMTRFPSPTDKGAPRSHGAIL